MASVQRFAFCDLPSQRECANCEIVPLFSIFELLDRFVIELS